MKNKHFSNGIMIQFGHLSNGTDGSTITLPLTYSSVTSYSPLGQGVSNTTDKNQSGATIFNKTITSFQLWSYGGGFSAGIGWITVGY